MELAKSRYAKTETWLRLTNVGQGCSIGAAATICPGIELGPFSLVGAGAVVTKSVPPFALVLGVPAKHVADVCSCGSRLLGTYASSHCAECGETPEQRETLLSQCNVAI